MKIATDAAVRDAVKTFLMSPRRCVSYNDDVKHSNFALTFKNPSESISLKENE